MTVGIAWGTITVISVYSSDSDPDSSEVHSSASSPSVPGSPTSSGASVCVVESSHYPTPDEPVMLSAASSVLTSPNRFRENCVSLTAEVYPVFEVSPDTTGSVLTSPPALPSSPMVSLPPPAPAFSPPGAPVSLDGLVLALPLLPLPDGMVLVPSWSAHRGGKAPLCCFLFKGCVQGGPLCCFRCAVGYWGSPVGNGHAAWLPLLYHMTSYEPMNLADVDPVYGLQLTHTRFLDFLGAPESARLLNGSRGNWVQFVTSLNRVSSEILPIGDNGRSLAGAPCASGCLLHVGHGAMAASRWSGCSRAVAGFFMQ